MKKSILMITMLMSLATITSMAQQVSDSRDKFIFGLKAGANYSNVYDTQGETFEANAKVGFAGGVFVALPIGKYIGIQPEVLFSQKGFKGTGTLLGSSYNITRTTNFIDVPLLLSIKPWSRLNLLVGPQFSYLLKQTDTFSSYIISTQQIQEFKNDNIRKNMLGFVAGFDVNLGHAVLGIRAGKDYLNNNGDGSSTTPRYKNMWLQGTVGFRF